MSLIYRASQHDTNTFTMGTDIIFDRLLVDMSSDQVTV